MRSSEKTVQIVGAEPYEGPGRDTYLFLKLQEIETKNIDYRTICLDSSAESFRTAGQKEFHDLCMAAVNRTDLQDADELIDSVVVMKRAGGSVTWLRNITDDLARKFFEGKATRAEAA